MWYIFRPYFICLDADCVLQRDSLEYIMRPILESDKTVACGGLVRLSNGPRTKDYSARLRANGKSKKDVLRCLKRAIAREAFHLLVRPEPVPATDDLRDLRQRRGVTLVRAAMSIGAEPTRLSELERGRRPNAELTAAYRAWLTAS